MAVAFHPPTSSSSFVSIRLPHAIGKTTFRIVSREKEIIDWSNRVDSDFFDATDKNDLRYSSSLSNTLVEVDSSLRWIPAMIPILAFVMYDPTAACFAAILDSLANNNFVAVDGGQYQAKIIAPAINGVVVPGKSILYVSL
jgi:hypothetical protein